MITNEDIICFSSIDWDFNWQGHQEIMRRLAGAGNRVLFVENTGVRRPSLRDLPRLRSRVRNWWRSYRGFREQEKGLFVFSPVVLPFPHSRIAGWLNRRIMLHRISSWCRSQRYSSPLIWSFLPNRLTLEVIEGLSGKLFVYYCIDSFEHSSTGASRIRTSESAMIERADLVFVTSEKLREHCESGSSNVHKFPFTVDYEPFEKARLDSSLTAPGDLAGLEGPRIGYIGGLHRWVDVGLLERLARRMSDASFVLVGPEQENMDRLRALDNVHLTGGRPHSELPRYLRFFDIGLIPYLRTDYTDNVFPTKLNEYLAMGLPVVSTPIREIVAFERENPGLVDLAADAEELEQAVRSRLEAVGSEEERGIRERRIEVARENSWSVRLEQMSGIIERRAAELRSGGEQRWRQRLADIYAGYRRKTVTVVLLLALAWAAFFWTPLVYWLGSPLKIEEPAVPSDAVLVFGGGVGETGRPGSSTFERARYAARLYDEGLAGHIVFSSGFQQFDNRDAEDMMKVALAENVEPEAVIIEPEAANNYQNVLYCLRIMKRREFSSALVVSGEYNMLRTELVIRRLLESGEYVPITPDSLHLRPVKPSIFFHPGEGNRLDQLGAVIHEYAAIVYYWWTGRI